MKRSKIFILSFSILLCSQIRSYGCVDDGYYGYDSYLIMNPNILDNRSWMNFFYFPDMYYGSMYQTDADEQILAKEWKQKLKLNSSQQAIYLYLFNIKDDTTGLSSSVVKELKTNKAWETFFTYAKQCENAVYWTDFWEDRDMNSDHQKQLKLIEQGDRLLAKQTDAFWKKKYAFQILRLAFYLDNKPKFNNTYETYFGFGNEQSPIDWWATHYKSMYLERTGDVDSANYLHAQVICNSSNKMHESLRWYRSHDLDKQIALCKTDEEKGNVYVTAALRNYNFSPDEIANAYKYTPQNKFLPLVLIREMNKLEEFFGRHKMELTQGWYYYNEDDSKYIYSLMNLYQSVKNMPLLEKANSDFYNLLLSELAIMNRDIDVAKKSIAKVKEDNKETLFEKNVLQLMLICISEDISTDDVQNKINTGINVLLKSRYGKFDSERILASTFEFVSNAYINKGLRAQGFLIYDYGYSFFSYYGEFYKYTRVDSHHPTAEKDLLDIIALYNKKDKNQLETFLLAPYPNDYQFWDEVGKIRLRNNQVEGARTAFHHIPLEGWLFNFNGDVAMTENPFIMSHLKKYQPEHVYWTKTEMIDTLYYYYIKENKGLQDYKLLGNLWYNFSNWGNSYYMMNDYYDNNFSTCEPEMKKDHYNSDINTDNLMALRNALMNYKEALKLSKSKEEQTEILYMLSWTCFMMGDEAEYIVWAGKYEQMKNTEFYKGEKCTITPLYDEPEILERALNGWSDLYYD